MTATAFGRCRRCRRVERFVCTGKFRVNASRSLIDVWLLFRCWRCGTGVRVPMVERVPMSRIRSQDLNAFRENDSVTTADLQGNVALLRQAGLFVKA